MKKLLYILLTIVITCQSISTVYAASSTPTPSAQPVITTEEDLEKIQKIKDMVASRVAELKIVEKRGILGRVKEISNTQITIVDFNENIRIIDIDELTKFQNSGSTTKSFGVSDLKAGDIVSFIGLYNKETKRLIARFATLKTGIPQQFEGVVVSKNIDEYTFVLINEKGDKRTIDVGTTTKTRSFTLKDNLVKSGFSKIQIGERALVTGYPDSKDKNLFLGDRIIYFIDVPLSSEMKKYQNNYASNPTPTIPNE